MNDTKDKKIKLSQDQIIKELIRDYPEEALEYLSPRSLKNTAGP